MVIRDYVEWEGLQRIDADGDNIAPVVRVHYEASGWQPEVRQTWTQPGEGGLFEDLVFQRAEIDPREVDAAPLTAVEIAAARAWFDSRAGRDAVHTASERARDDALAF